MSGGITVTSQYTVAGTVTDVKDNHLLPGNVLNKASCLGIAGNVVMHNEHTTTDSVIGGNITVNAGSITGKIVKDADAANGYIKDHFAANKMQSNFDKQNNLTDLAVSAIDKHHPEIIAEGKETGRMISSGIGAVGWQPLGVAMLDLMQPLEGS